MEESHVVDEDTPKAAEHVLAQLGVALVKGRTEGSCRLEGLSLASEPGWEDERADDAERDVGRHPELITGASLSGVVACWDEQGEFTDTVGDDRCETSANQPSELLVGCVCDEGLLHDKNNRNGEHRNGEEDSVQTQRGVQETREPLGSGHLSNLITPKTKVELE